MFVGRELWSDNKERLILSINRDVGAFTGLKSLPDYWKRGVWYGFLEVKEEEGAVLIAPNFMMEWK